MQPEKLRRFQRKLWDPLSGSPVFLLALYLAGISVNVASNRVAELPWMERAFFYGGPVLLIVFGSRLLRFLVGTEADATASYGPTARPSRGLVVLVSTGEGSRTALRAVEHHVSELQRLWLVYSADPGTNLPTSRDEALKLRETCVGRGWLRNDQIADIELTTRRFFHPEAVRAAIEECVYDTLSERGLEPNEVFIDITGGKKETTAGAFLAGLPPGRRLQITPAKEFDERGRGTVPGEPVEIRIDYRCKPMRSR